MPTSSLAVQTFISPTKEAAMRKAADGGDTAGYELAFSNIAHQYVQDRAPKLSEYEVGFQLLDKSDEGDKAVGVFGFKAGPNWFNAPVFYLAGKVKGYELLFVKNENIFVPLRENWIDYLLSKRPSVLGTSIDRNSRLFGVSNPDFTQLSRSPTKYASHDIELFKGLAKAACDTSLIDKGFEGLNLASFLKEASLPIVEKFLAICQEFPKVAATFDSYHGIETLAEAVKLAKARAAIKPATGLFATEATDLSISAFLGTTKQADDKPNNGSQKGLKILSPDNTEQTVIPEVKDQATLEKMLERGYVMQDDRNESEMSRLYNAESTSKLTNPTVTGVYDVLLKEGEFAKCLVIMYGRGATSHAPFATVIELSDDPKYVNVKPIDVWVGDSDARHSYSDWWKDLKDVSVEGNDYYVAIGPNGDATIPFRRDYEYDGGTRIPLPSTKKEDGTEIFPVDMDDNWAGRYETHRIKIEKFSGDEQTGSSGDYYDKYTDGQRVHINGARGSRLRSFRGDVYVPEGYKIVRVEKYVSAKGPDADSLPYTPYKKEPLKTGDLASAYFHIIGKTAAFGLGNKDDMQKSLELATDKLVLSSYNGEYKINDFSTRKKSAAIIHLAKEHWLREDAAEFLVKQADSLRGEKQVYRIKYAERISQDAPSSPNIPPDYISHGNEVNPDEATMYPQEYAIPVPSLRADWSNRQQYNPNTHFDPNAGGLGGGYASSPYGGGKANQDDVTGGDLAAAIGSGQKEVFDTSVIGTLLKAVRDDSLSDRYLGKLVGGVDALGRLLFQFYWHGDEFAERYGKQDMPELEDSLRNAFEQVGDVVLFLRQKSVNSQGENSSGIDLGSASNATNGL